MVIKPEPVTYGSITINYHETATNSITDLTGTKWEFNSILTIGGDSDSDATYNLNFKSNNVDFTVLKYSAIGYRIFYRLNSSDVPGTNAYTGNPTKPHGPSTTGTWADEAFRTISITGGTDTTNATLISWLQSNATQIQEQSSTFSFGNLPIANMFFGTQQVKKVYLGNTLVWEKAETGYTVTLNCGTEYRENYNYTKGSVHVYDSTYADRSSSNLIFSQDSIDLSAYPATLTVKSGYCTVIIDTTGSFMGSYITSSDFAVSEDMTYGISKEFVVDKNGAIEFGAYDWDD